MNHIPSNDLISAYVDDRLSREERAAVEVLLQSSDEARAELESYRQLRTALQALPTEPAPPDLLTRIMAQAEQESLHGKPAVAAVSAGATGSFWKRWTIPSVSVAASLALLIVMMFKLQSPQDASNRSTQPELASNVSDYDSDRIADSTEMTATTIADGESTFIAGQLNEAERELLLSDGVRVVPQDRENGTFNMLSTYEIGRAEIGDVIEALQVQDDRVIVVQLRVIDHQRVLDGMHVLLSKVNVPRETPETNSYGAKSNDLLAIYIEAGRGEVASLLSELQENSDVEQMLVSTSIPSDTLNQYAFEQGYRELYARNSYEKQAGSTRRAMMARQALKDPIATDEPAAEASGRGRPFDDLSIKDENSNEALSLSNEAKKNRAAFGGGFITKSEWPPPPPLPEQREGWESTAQKEAAPPKAALPEAPTPASDIQYFDSSPQLRNRYAQIRFPESVGKDLIQHSKGDGQMAISNGEADQRAASNQNFKRDRSETLRKEPKAPLPPAGADLKLAADKPPVETKPREAAEADEKQKLLAEERSNIERPLRILFVLTDEPPRPTEAAQPGRPEAQPKAQD